MLISGYGWRGCAFETEATIEDLQIGFWRAAGRSEKRGFCQIDRLRTDWDAGTVRFERDGEALLAVRVNGTLAGIGGLTVDPVVPSALRMLCFYIQPAFRRGGVGRELVLQLLARMRQNQVVSVNAAAGSVPFWAAMGFTHDPRERRRHILDRASPWRPINARLNLAWWETKLPDSRRLLPSCSLDTIPLGWRWRFVTDSACKGLARSSWRFTYRWWRIGPNSINGSVVTALGFEWRG
jgi:GNAT superfamily N-acetyltransferase